MDRFLSVRGARENNLKNISCEIPRRQLVAVTGVSGSGKSSLVFGTIFREAWRRTLLSSLISVQGARQLAADVDAIEGLSFAVPLLPELPHGRLHTVCSWADLLEPLRQLFFFFGSQRCSDCGGAVVPASKELAVAEIESALLGRRIEVRCAPGEWSDSEELQQQLLDRGFTMARLSDMPVRIEGQRFIEELEESPESLRIIIDSFLLRPESIPRLNESLALALGSVGAEVATADDEQPVVIPVRQSPYCSSCGLTTPPLHPEEFLYYREQGACSECAGAGLRYEFEESLLLDDTAGSLREGGIVPWRDPFLAPSEEEAAAILRSGVSPDSALSVLTPKKLQRLLFGSSLERRFPHFGVAGVIAAPETFIKGGVAGLLRARYHRTKSRPRRERIERFVVAKPCATCSGARVVRRAGLCTFGGTAFAELLRGPVGELAAWCRALSAPEGEVASARRILFARHFEELRAKCETLVALGLSYLGVMRAARSLSAGEVSRTRLAREIGVPMQGVLYLLDEPSIGLHPRDTGRLQEVLRRLVAQGSSVLLVEHDLDLVRQADHVLELGPGAGKEGGTLVYAGHPAGLQESDTPTGEALRQESSLPHIDAQELRQRGALTIRDATLHNLRIDELNLPLQSLVVLVGVSGSGKTTLLLRSLLPALRSLLTQRDTGTPPESAVLSDSEQARYGIREIEGWEELGSLKEAVRPGELRNRRSVAASIAGILPAVRALYAETIDAKVRGFGKAHFSFNSPSGACPRCRGTGSDRLPVAPNYAIELSCAECAGQRYRPEILQVRFKGLHIAELLALSFRECRGLLSFVPELDAAFQVIEDLGLSYLTLGQEAPALSLGERQRLKLVSELQAGKKASVFFFDEPTRGLHVTEVRRLIHAFRKLVAAHHSVIVIEHSVELARAADYLVELGPGAGKDGGRVLAAGTPEQVKAEKESIFGSLL